MRCKNCNIEIEENEVFCNKCRKEMKKISSRVDIKELERLIENQKRLNDLENTKELVDLEKLVKEELKEEEIQNTNIIDPDNINHQEVEMEDIFVEKNENKKTLIIIIVSVISVLVVGIIIALFILNNEEQIEPPNTIDYKKVINDYGKNIEEIIEKYLNENNELPTLQQVNELITYNKYEVICEINNIYSDGSIYLSDCKVDGAEVQFSFGEEKEDVKEGKKVPIYKLNNEGYNLYLKDNQDGSLLSGTINCKTEECEYVSAYDKYVIIEEEGLNYLYNYETDTMEFGPFDIKDEYMPDMNILSYNNILYGIFYEESGLNNIYSTSTGKILRNIKGTPVINKMYYDPTIMYKYNYIAIDNNGKTNFVNLKTGNIGFSIKENLGPFIEDVNKKIVYILGYIDNSNNFKIYNSKGKLLFDGKTFSQFEVGDNNLIVADGKQFKVYDKDLILQTSSKKYDEILDVCEDFVIVIKDKNLKILSIEDKEFVTFEDVWDNNSVFVNNLSGWNTMEGKEVINIVVEDKSSLGSYTNYYYIPSTKESGVY